MTSAAISFVLFMVGITCFPIVLGFLAGVWEKRLVWPYVNRVDPEPKAQEDTSNPYAAPGVRDGLTVSRYGFEVCRQAGLHGFRSFGHRYHQKAKLYKMRYDFWLAPDDNVLAIVGVGTVAGIRLEATWMYTLLRNRHALVTLDEAKGGDSDMSGMTEQFVLSKADFAELLACHRNRMASASSEVVPCSADDPFQWLEGFRAARADRLVELGLARYLDADHRQYKYTVKGALFASVWSTCRQWARAFRDRNRTLIQRPGDASYVPSTSRHRRPLAWMNTLKTICWVFLFANVFQSFIGGRPPMGRPNTAQILFRIVIPALGLFGLIVLWIIGLVARRSRPVESE